MQGCPPSTLHPRRGWVGSRSAQLLGKGDLSSWPGLQKQGQAGGGCGWALEGPSRVSRWAVCTCSPPPRYSAPTLLPLLASSGSVLRALGPGDPAFNCPLGRISS